ncbi:MAG: zinc ribbon domain-containing protein [Candidatus Delongbacteria bacterium]|nr:zinc ribbon domain-containing protein [Candidatus Delongbacteria bacterium]
MTKKCPYCAEDIQDEAIKCKHCGEFLNTKNISKDKTPWYFRVTFIVFMVLSVGPFSLPLIWWHPEMSRSWKTTWTVIILIMSWIFYIITVKTIDNLQEYYKLLDQLSN